MAYVLAAYGIVAAALVAYGVLLMRERRALRHSLGEGSDRIGS